LADGASIPTKSEAQRTGLTLATIESAEIQPGRRVTLSTGLLVSSFDGRQIHINNTVRGPSGDVDKVRVLSHYLACADHSNEIKVFLANFGSTPYLDVSIGSG
jgi:dUTPase